MINQALNILLEKLANLENRQNALEVQFIDYVESEPSKSSMQWVEERLRVLESQVNMPLSIATLVDRDLEPINSRLDNLEEAMQLRPVSFEIDNYIRAMEESFRNHQASVNQRINEWSQKYDSIDPRYLAMGENLSKANQNMMTAIVDNKRYLLELILELRQKIGIITDELKGREVLRATKDFLENNND